MRRRVPWLIPWQRSFLGFTLTEESAPRRRIADKAVARFKDRVRHLTGRNRGVSLQRMIADLNPLLRGWAGYFGLSQLRELPSLDGWSGDAFAAPPGSNGRPDRGASTNCAASVSLGGRPSRPS